MLPSNLYIGTSGWSFEDWCGSFYPEFARREEFLTLYCEHFNSVEVESTARRMPGKEALRRWRSRTPDHFKFALAAPRELIAGNEIRNAGSGTTMARFLANAEELGGNLGPIIFNFPYSFKIDRLPDMTAFVKSLPRGFAFVVEMRHKDWINEMFLDCLREKKVSLGYSSIPWMEPALDEKTAETAYIRFRGGKKDQWEDFSRTRTDETDTMKKIAPYAAEFARKHRPVFSFFSNNFEGHAPASAAGFMQIMKKYFK